MTDQNSTEQNRLFESGLWSLTSRWLVKFIGFISTLFIVRLLMPEDFGIVMKTILVFDPLATCVSIGFSGSLIQIKNPTKQHYDTAFTANIILAIAVAILLNIIAPLGASFFKEPALAILLPILSLKVLFLGLINPRLQDLLRDFHYKKDFQYLICSKIFHISCIVACCFYFRNYYGLIVGQTIGEFGSVCISYYLIHYKPAFSLKYIKDYNRFSIPNMRAGIGDYVLMNIDRLLLSRFVNNRMLGFYNLAYELAEQFTTEIIYPLARAFFPVFADLEDNPEKLKSTYLSGMSFLIPLSLGIGIGLSLIAKPLILVYVGEKWSFTADLLCILALSAASQAFCLVNASVLGATGRIKIRARLTTANALLSTFGIIYFAVNADIMNVILVKALISVFFVCVNLYVTCRVLGIKFMEIALLFVRPIIASIFMIIVLLNISVDNKYIELLSMLVSGVVTFIASHFLLWIAAGKPQSIEYAIFKKIKFLKLQ